MINKNLKHCVFQHPKWMQYSIVLLNIVDGNGATEIASMCIVSTECEDNLKWFLQKIQNRNPEVSKRIRSFMGDKDISARRIVKEMFGVPMYIYVHSILQRFLIAQLLQRICISVRLKERLY